MKTASLHGGNVVIFNTSVVSSSSSIDLSQWRGLVICELRTANWRTGNMRTNMRTRPMIGRDITRVPRAVRKVPHGVRSSHCFVSRPNEPDCIIAESCCICIFMTGVTKSCSGRSDCSGCSGHN